MTMTETEIIEGAQQAAADALPSAGLIDHGAAARYLSTPAATLHGWNSRGIGPKSYRLGRRRMYRIEDLDRWLEEQANDTRRAG